MALWGKADSIYSPGTVTVDYAAKTVTGSGTSFTSATVGSVISIGVGITFGEAVISAITSATVVSIAETSTLSGAPISGVAYTMSQKPIYVLKDSNYVEGAGVGLGTIHSVYGVDVYEAQAAVNTKQKVAHAGWVGVHTYIDMHGNYRVKSEVLVAFSGITTGTAAVGAATSYGDAADDTAYPDYLISFTTQPSDRTGISTREATTFAVVASASPNATLTYQWQYASSVGAGYTNLSNGGVYTNVTTATVGINSTAVAASRPDGFYYRAVVTTNTTDGYATTTSNAARLTYA
jgi:hypothetical protein